MASHGEQNKLMASHDKAVRLVAVVVAVVKSKAP